MVIQLGTYLYALDSATLWASLQLKDADRRDIDCTYVGTCKRDQVVEHCLTTTELFIMMETISELNHVGTNRRGRNKS